MEIPSEMDYLRAFWKFNNCFVVDCEDRRGGLSMLWTSDIDLKITSFSLNHIDCTIGKVDDPDRWQLTGFYGANEVGRRHITFGLLKTLVGVSNLPWLCVGNFNELISHDEKLGEV